MTKVLSNVVLVLLNVTIEPLKCEEKKGTTKCDKRTVTYDVGIWEKRTTKCDKSTVNCDVATA